MGVLQLNVGMQKKEQNRTVEFGQLSQDHKAEFIQFLIKNNICFQEGKENCTAQVAIPPSHHTPKPIRTPLNNHNRPNKQPNKPQPLPYRPQKQMKENRGRSGTPEAKRKQLKTPTKVNKSGGDISQASRKGKSQTIKRPLNHTPDKPTRDFSGKKASQFRSRSNTLKEKPETFTSIRSKENLGASQQRETRVESRPSMVSRERVVTKYAGLFGGLSEGGRAVRWPIGVLERAIEQVYDEVFAKNTQSLSRNMGSAMKSLNLTSFPRMVEAHFRKKYKNSKLYATNLNNLLYTLSLSVQRQNCVALVSTFEGFLTGDLQQEDLLYYLFTRNILKRQVRQTEKGSSNHKHEGSYFPHKLRHKEVMRCLRAIIGSDCQLLGEYRELIELRMQGQLIDAYEFLRILMTDYHDKRISSSPHHDQNSSLFDQESFEARNTDELTFGEEHEHQAPGLTTWEVEEHTVEGGADRFWEVLEYRSISDSLLDLIMEKMGRKVVEFIGILASGLTKSTSDLRMLERLLLGKAEGLLHAVFEMNKMKWFKELAITCPSEEDMALAEQIQMRLRELRDNPSGRGIGQFCKALLTTRSLINQLQLALSPQDVL